MRNILKLIKCKILDSFPLNLIVLGIIAGVFTIWQLDVMFKGLMWGRAIENIGFYQELIRRGFSSYASSDVFTINVELFPQGMFTSGFWYDALMGINILCFIPVILGAYLLNRKCNKYKKKLELCEVSKLKEGD